MLTAPALPGVAAASRVAAATSDANEATARPSPTTSSNGTCRTARSPTYNLIRLEEPSSTYRSKYVSAFNTPRNCTGSHQNAHFNMIDRGVRATVNATRDAETLRLLDLWVQRRRRDYPTDVSAKYPSCGTNRSCMPVAVSERVNTDFLWQRSPFTVAGGKYGTQETAGIDFILPYWGPHRRVRSRADRRPGSVLGARIS